MKHKHATRTAFLCALFVSVILISLLYFNVFSTWQLKLSDSLYGRQDPMLNVAIVAIDDKSLQEIGRWPWSRAVWADILEKLSSARVIGIDVAFFENSTAQDDEKLGGVLRKLNAVIPKEYYGFETENGKLVGKDLLVPIPSLHDVSTGVVNVFTESDSVTRAVPDSINNNPSLSFAVAEKLLGTSIEKKNEKMLIRFTAPGAYPVISASDILFDRVVPEQINGKILFVGATAADLHDSYTVPTGPHMAGVEVHANALQTAVSKRFLQRQQAGNIMLLIIIFAALTALIVDRLRLLLAIPLLALLLAGYVVIAIMFFEKGLILNLVYPILGVLITATGSYTILYTLEAAHKRQVVSIFGKYVSPDVAKVILSSDKMPELGGAERHITILFADIRGFTSLSETLTPREVINMLNHYLGEMTEVIFKEKGTLDKYVGDCIMALWNAPLDLGDHAYYAVKAALGMQEVLKKSHKEGVPKVKVGIGLNTGDAIVGNMGSKLRLDYTALGDSVNTASRLCHEAKGDEVIISESTYQLVKDRFKVKKLEPVLVKGKKEPLQIYLVQGLR